MREKSLCKADRDKKASLDFMIADYGWLHADIKYPRNVDEPCNETHGKRRSLGQTQSSYVRFRVSEVPSNTSQGASGNTGKDTAEKIQMMSSK